MKYYKVGTKNYAITAADECLVIEMNENETSQGFIRSKEEADRVKEIGLEITRNDFIEIAHTVSDICQSKALQFAKFMFI